MLELIVSRDYEWWGADRGASRFQCVLCPTSHNLTLFVSSSFSLFLSPLRHSDPGPTSRCLAAGAGKRQRSSMDFNPSNPSWSHSRSWLCLKSPPYPPATHEKPWAKLLANSWPADCEVISVHCFESLNLGIVCNAEINNEQSPIKSLATRPVQRSWAPDSLTLSGRFSLGLLVLGPRQGSTAASLSPAEWPICPLLLVPSWY